jgi:hypothetical protein
MNNAAAKGVRVILGHQTDLAAFDHGLALGIHALVGQTLSSAGERSLHTGEVVGSIPTAPTIDFNALDFFSCNRADVSPTKRY